MHPAKKKALLMVAGVLIVFFAGTMLFQEARAEVQKINVARDNNATICDSNAAKDLIAKGSILPCVDVE